MRFKKKNGLYQPDHYMGCMGVEDTSLMPRYAGASRIPKGINTPNRGGTTGGDRGSSTSIVTPDTINERFEDFAGDGYDWTWPTQDGGAALVVKQDSTATPPGNPSGWGSYCLKMAQSGTTQTGLLDDTPSFSLPICYTRVEFVITVSGLGTDQAFTIHHTYTSGWSELWKFDIYKEAASLTIHPTIFKTDGVGTALTAANIVTGTRYRLESMYNATAQTWEWKLDGTSKQSGSDLGAARGNCAIVNIGIYDADAGPSTVYFDNVGVDANEWIGAPA